MDLLSRLRNGLVRRWYAPAIAVAPIAGLVRLGSHDCGLTLQPSDDLAGATIVSAGLGEDASFDIEFASRFGARVVVVDPTPRSITYFEALTARVGVKRSRDYAMHGPQPIESYDMQGLKSGDLVLEKSALWCEDGSLQFFAPPNPDYVSYSITNIQNDYSRTTPHIVVPAISPETLMQKYGLKTIPLMKLDIEGAETRVIPYMFSKGIFPRQLLVEYDEILDPSARAKSSTEATHAALTAAGYVVRHASDVNYLYIRE